MAAISHKHDSQDSDECLPGTLFIDTDHDTIYILTAVGLSYYLFNIQDGSCWRSQPFIQKNPNVGPTLLEILRYIDDTAFEVLNGTVNLAQ